MLPILNPSPTVVPLTFITSWKTDNAGTSTATQITIPTVISGSYSCAVDWGDSNISNISTYNDAAWTHTYSVAGTYTVRITGIFNGIEFNNGGDKLKLLNISGFGAMRLGNTGAYFSGCTNLTITANDNLDLTGTTTLINAFANCSSIITIPTITSWNFSSITSLQTTFIGCSKFNQTLNGIDVSHVTTMSGTFQNCVAFNGDVTLWQPTACVTLNQIFQNCTVFNQAVGSWTTSSVTVLSSCFQGCSAFNQSLGWDTSKATTVMSMFSTCSVYNKTITFNLAACTNSLGMFFNCLQLNSAITLTNTNLITTMAQMFQGCTVFNQDVSAWSIAALTSATNMFTSSGFALVNYNKLLDSATGWPSQATIQNGVAFSAGTAHYSTGNPTTGRLVLTGTHTWTITDGGTP